MKTTRSIFKMLQVTAALLVLCFSTQNSWAQHDHQVIKNESNSLFKYRGLEAGFGVRNFTLSSDVPELQKFAVTEEGGTAAFIFGNNFSRIATSVGLYYSTAGTKRTIDQLEVAIDVNLYLLKALNIPSNKVDVYLLTGLSNQHLKFFGHYIDESERANKKAGAREPYLGKITTSNVNLGFGVEYKLEAESEFIHFFAEGHTSYAVSAKAEIQPLSNTGIENNYALNIGVRFGKIKF